MVAATPPVPSFGALARAALADDDWPPSSRPQPRSLEALLGKLDRDLELGWLAERPAVRKCLARALRCPVESLERGPAREPAGPGGGGGRVRLEPLRFGRALDLREEALFPGIPAEVLRPARWGRLWWVAPPGAGQSLVGRWLAARGLADPVALTCSSEARSIAGPARPLFVELQRDDGLLPDLDAPVCVAAPFPPGDGSFAVVRSPPVQDVLPALVAWAAARLPADGGFDVERTLEWFARGALASGVVDTVETALGLCGALDEIGFRAAVREPLAEVARRFVGRRVGELTRAGHADAAWLRRSAHELLVELMTRLLVEPTNPWHDPRSLDAWLALVPEEFQREVDVDWMRALLASDDGPIRSRDVERAARRLPPGAFRVVRGLRAAGLLEEVGPGGDLALRPRWLGRVLAQQARQRLARGAPLELGAGLLSPFEAEGIAQELLQRLRGGDLGAVEDVLDLETEESLAATTALEAVFRTTGLAVLEGVEIPAELLAALAEEQLRLAVTLDDELPRPRVAHRAPAGSLLGDGCFWLASLALTEGLDGVRPRSSPLDPWRASTPPRGLRAALDGIAADLAQVPAERAIATYALVDRLRLALGQLGDPCHPLERPGVALDELTLGVATWDVLAELDRLPHGPAALAALGARRGVDADELCREVWRAAVEARVTVTATPLFDPASTFGAALWRAAPPAAWTAMASRDEAGLDLGLADAATLDALRARWPELGPRVREAFWRSAPEAPWRAGLAEHPPTTTAEAAIAWARSPPAVAASLPVLLAAGADAAPLLAAAPRDQTATIAAAIEPLRLDAVPEPTLLALRRWAHAAVATRAPGGVRAFALLAAVERDLAKVPRR